MNDIKTFQEFSVSSSQSKHSFKLNVNKTKLLSYIFQNVQNKLHYDQNLIFLLEIGFKLDITRL